MSTTSGLEMLQARDVSLELLRRGTGQPLLFLHDGGGPRPQAPFLDRLAEHFQVIAPSHPGFGRSSLPDNFDKVDDLAFFYLDLIDALGLDDLVLVGASFGGWIAAEVAVRCCHRLARLVLVDPLGIKIGDRETRDIADIYALSQARVAELTYHDPAAAAGPDLASLPDEELAMIARNRESLALFGWDPYFYNPKLRQRLHRISVPALLVWGANDGIVTPAYGAAYRDAIPGARLEIIPEAGHLPHLERPAAFVEHVLTFCSQP